MEHASNLVERTEIELNRRASLSSENSEASHDSVSNDRLTENDNSVNNSSFPGLNTNPGFIGAEDGDRQNDLYGAGY